MKDLNEMDEHAIPADLSIPYYVHESDMNRLDQSHKRIEKWIMIFAFIIFIAFVVTNAWWIHRESEYEDVTTTIMQETSSEGGGDAILHGDNAGATFYGESKTDDYN